MLRHTRHWEEVEPHIGNVALVFFPRLILADVWRIASEAKPGRKVLTFLVKMFHWRWNLRIAWAQLFTDLRNAGDHKWEYVHVALLVRFDRFTHPRNAAEALKGNTVRLIEATYPAGVEIKNPAAKFKKFTGEAVVVEPYPLVENGNILKLVEWIIRIQGQPYDVGGALSSPFFFLSIHRLGKFCSYLGANALQILGRLPEWKTIPNFSHKTLMDLENRAEDYTPSELAREAEALPSESWYKAHLVKG